MKKIVLALCAALTVCGCAHARRPWTEALALVSPDMIRGASADAAPAAANDASAAASLDSAVSADAPAAASNDVPAPTASGDAAVSADAGDSGPAFVCVPGGPPLFITKEAPQPPVSTVVSADATDLGDVSVSPDVEPEPVIVTLSAPHFTAQAPEGWLLEEIDETSSAVCAPDNSVALIVTVIPAKNTTLRRAAEQLANRHGGFKTLKRLPDTDGTGDAWEYRGTLWGQRMYAQVFDLPQKRLGTIVIWKDPDAPDAAEVFNSIRFKETLIQ